MNSTAVFGKSRVEYRKHHKYMLLHFKGQPADPHRVATFHHVDLYSIIHNLKNKSKPIIRAHNFDNPIYNSALPFYLALRAMPVNKSASTFKL